MPLYLGRFVADRDPGEPVGLKSPQQSGIERYQVARGKQVVSISR